MRPCLWHAATWTISTNSHCYGMQASCSEGHLSVDSSTLAMLADSFFARAGKSNDETLLLEDFITVLSSRPEIRQSIQFGGVQLKASSANRDVSKAVEALPLSERLYAKALQALKVNRGNACPRVVCQYLDHYQWF